MSTDRTDPMAAHRAVLHLRDLLANVDDLRGEIECECGEKHERYLDEESQVVAEQLADQFTAGFERRVNEYGVAVRRVVLRRPEEVDPNPPAELLAHAREDIPALLAENERLRAQLAELAAAEVTRHPNGCGCTSCADIRQSVLA